MGSDRVGGFIDEAAFCAIKIMRPYEDAGSG